MSKVDYSPVIIRDFTIRPLTLASQQLINQSSLKLQVTTEDARVQKPMIMSTKSKDVLWTAKGGAKISSATRQIRISVSVEDEEVVTELCNTTISRVHLAKHAREYSKDLYGFALNSATSSMVLLVTCTASIPPSQKAVPLNQSATSVSNSTSGGSSFIRNPAPSYQSLPRTSSAQMSPEYLELEHSYDRTKNMPREDRAYALNSIGRRYLPRLQGRSDTVVLDRVISILDEAFQCSSVSDRCRGKYLADFSFGLLTRFESVRDPIALNGAIAASQEAALITDEDSPYTAQMLHTYVTAVTFRYELFGDVEDLQLAITQFKKVIDFVSDPIQRIPILNVLAAMFTSRFQRLGYAQDLEAAVLHLQKALGLTPDDHPERPDTLNNLGNAFKMKFDCLGNLKDLDASIRHNQLALKLTPDGHPERPDVLTSLGVAFEARFNRMGHTKDIETAVRYQQMAVELAPNGHPTRLAAFNNLGSAFQTRFNRLGRIEDLEAAIDHGQIAVKLAPDGHPTKPHMFSNLGNALEARFDRLDRIEDLEAAIHYKQTAVKLTPDGHPDKPAILNHLGNVFGTQFDRLGRVEDIEAAIHYRQLALELTPDGHPDKSVILNNLGIAFERRFNRLGRVEDIEAAIRHSQLAVELTPDGHPDKPSRLGNLGIAFETRFDRLGDVEDIETAIRYQQTAVKLTPDGHPDKLMYLSNLGSAFQTRFDRLGRVEDIEAAIHHIQLAVELTPDGYPAKPIRLNSLANALDERFSLLKKVEDIEASLSHRRMAVKLTPEGHSSKRKRLTGLANTLVMRYRHLDDVMDIEEAITNHQMALELLPERHPDKSMVLTNLGNAFSTRYAKLNQQSDLQSAHKCSSSVANLVSAPPANRLLGARRSADFSIKLGVSPIPAYQVAIDMLPRVAWLGLPIHGQHALLEEKGEVVRDAIGAAIENEEYELAVEWAEAGRSIAWQNFLNLRSPLDELRSVYPELAARLQSISQRLETVGPNRGQTDERNPGYLKDPGVEARSSTLLGLDWDKAVEEVRTKPGFESFLKAKSFSQLAQVAHKGPVVILNVQEKGSMALILISEEGGGVYTTSVSLSDFRLQEGQMLHSNLMKVLIAGHVRDRNHRKIHRVKEKHVEDGTLEDILKTLWVKVVKPVIEALAYQPRTNDLPHIWWCATGPLAFLPVHAAGIYDAEHEEPGHKLSDYAVSSYTPTLSALFDDLIPDCKDIKILAVAQANAPGASRIPKTEDEVRIIEKIASDMPFTSLMKGDATIERVLEGMEKSSWVHLACHGQQNAEQPMKSGLLLHNGKLELEKLISTRLPNADFAFLSACQTATGDEKVAEESVHLAAGMLFSGYKGVIATMWSINDSIAPQIAEDVYRYMLGNGKPDRKKAAHALHYAVKRLREEYKADVLTWVPFIHIGR